MSDTDVAHSIAGYYYQILLACNELVKLLNSNETCDNDWVALEKGSDVKVCTNSNGTVSIESKFYKNKSFTKKNETIRHTIYNFYNDYVKKSNSEKTRCVYIYRTNVAVSNKFNSDVFFEEWNQKKFKDENIYINYIKECLVHESISSAEIYRDNFKKYKHRNININRKPKKDQFSEWYQILIEDILEGKENINDYTNFEEDQVREFIKLINFDFHGNKKMKMEYIKDLYQNIEAEIRRFKYSINNDFFDIIRNHLVELFCKSVVDRGNTNYNSGIITVQNLKKIIDQPENITLNILISKEKTDLLDKIRYEIENLQFKLRKYSDEYKIKVISVFFEICERFIEKYCESGKNFREFVSEYTLDDTYGFSIITNISYAMSILAVFAEIDSNSIKLGNHNGIRNFSFDENNIFSIKGTDSRIRESEHMILNFIRKHVKSYNYPSGDEIIVFDNPALRSNNTPCKYDKNEIDGLITEYTRTYEIEYDHELFKNLDYRCTDCFEIMKDSQDTMKNVSNFTIKRCRGVI